MGFYLWTCIGIAVGILHLLIPGQHRVGPASAIALGIGGAWNGALVAAAFVRGGWAAFPPLALAGAIVGAVGTIAAMEIVAERWVASDRVGATGPAEPPHRSRLHA